MASKFVRLIQNSALVFALLGAASATTGCGYNDVITEDENVKAAWAEVQNQYQRRADLIPNLVKTVKAAGDCEKETLQGVIDARSKVGQMQVDSSIIDDPEKLKAFQAAQGNLGSALSRLMVVVEKYPTLKATDQYRDLQAQLEGTENRITVARQRFITAVSAYNQVVLHFPSSLGASMRGKKERATFEATVENADKPPEVNF
jgi:LemA protein